MISWLGYAQATLYAAGGELLLVQEGVVVRSTEGLSWTRGQPWEQIERRLQYRERLQGADAEPCAACGEPVGRFGTLVFQVRNEAGEVVRRYHPRCAPKEGE